MNTPIRAQLPTGLLIGLSAVIGATLFLLKVAPGTFLQSLQADLGLSDFEMSGLMGTAPTLLATALAVGFAVLGDLFGHRRVMGACVLFGPVGCLLAATAGSLIELWISRVMALTGGTSAAVLCLTALEKRRRGGGLATAIGVVAAIQYLALMPMPFLPGVTTWAELHLTGAVLLLGAGLSVCAWYPTAAPHDDPARGHAQGDLGRTVGQNERRSSARNRGRASLLAAYALASVAVYAFTTWGPVLVLRLGDLTVSDLTPLTGVLVGFGAAARLLTGFASDRAAARSTAGHRRVLTARLRSFDRRRRFTVGLEQSRDRNDGACPVQHRWRSDMGECDDRGDQGRSSKQQGNRHCAVSRDRIRGDAHRFFVCRHAFRLLAHHTATRKRACAEIGARIMRRAGTGGRCLGAEAWRCDCAAKPVKRRGRALTLLPVSPHNGPVTLR